MRSLAWSFCSEKSHSTTDDMRGVCLIAYGDKAEREAHECLTTLKQFHDWPYRIAADSIGHQHIGLEQTAGYSNIQKSRWAKVTLDLWTPFEQTLYLDADTRVQGDISAGFEMLEDGWEMVMSPSGQQGKQNMWHVSPDEREATYEAYQCNEVLQMQGGVFWFGKSLAVSAFFAAWRDTWLRWQQFDQAALLRALRVAPVKLHLLSKVYNGGALIQHRHGRAVR